MGKEVKISLALVGALVIFLIALLGRSLLSGGDPPPADPEEKVAASDPKTSGEESDEGVKKVESSLAASGGRDFGTQKPKVVPARPRAPSETPEPSDTRNGVNRNGVGPCRFATDNDSHATAAPPSMMPPKLSGRDEAAYRTAAVPGRPSHNNPFSAGPGQADTTERVPVRSDLPSARSDLPAARSDLPSVHGGAVAPYRRYGGEAGAMDSSTRMSPAQDETSDSHRNLPPAPPGYDRHSSYRGAASGHGTSQDRMSQGGTSQGGMSQGGGNPRFRTTSSRVASPYGTGSRVSSAGGGGFTPTATLSRAEPGKYTVEPNDSFWKISERIYGSGAYFRALAEHNRDICPNPHRLQTGTVIDAPEISELRAKFPELCPSAEKEETRRRRESLGSAGVASSGDRVYVVQAGDTLYDIARYELDNASRWGEIVALNKNRLGDNYDYLTPGMKLVLPTDSVESFQPAQQLSRPSIRTATPPRIETRRY